MIKLSSQSYILQGVTIDEFWSKLDKITVGQHINPEISYTTVFDGNHNNVFGGRKKKNRFSIYLYRPITRGFRTEILAKGVVNYSHINEEIKIDCKFEIPFWSILMFLVISSIIILPVVATSLIAGIIISSIVIMIYGIIIGSNHSDIKKELQNQLRKITTANTPL